MPKGACCHWPALQSGSYFQGACRQHVHRMPKHMAVLVKTSGTILVGRCTTQFLVGIGSLSLGYDLAFDGHMLRAGLRTRGACPTTSTLPWMTWQGGRLRVVWFGDVSPSFGPGCTSRTTRLKRRRGTIHVLDSKRRGHPELKRHILTLMLAQHFVSPAGIRTNSAAFSRGEKQTQQPSWVRLCLTFAGDAHKVATGRLSHVTSCPDAAPMAET